MTCPVDWSMCTVREERVFCYRCMECLQRSVKAVGPKGASKPSVSWLLPCTPAPPSFFSPDPGLCLPSAQLWTQTAWFVSGNICLHSTYLSAGVGLAKRWHKKHSLCSDQETRENTEHFFGLWEQNSLSDLSWVCLAWKSFFKRKLC